MHSCVVMERFAMLLDTRVGQSLRLTLESFGLTLALRLILPCSLLGRQSLDLNVNAFLPMRKT